jgi:ElaB/YqjD/DUF883 family membrane-anchored ribosome-binding protein
MFMESLLTSSSLPAPNALSELKSKIKGFLKGKKSKKEDKPVEATKTEATNGATATEVAPAEPTPAADARKSP